MTATVEGKKKVGETLALARLSRKEAEERRSAVLASIEATVEQKRRDFDGVAADVREGRLPRENADRAFAALQAAHEEANAARERARLVTVWLVRPEDEQPYVVETEWARVLEYIDESEPGDVWLIERGFLLQSDVEALPEFGGW